MPSGGYRIYDCKNKSALYPNSVKMPGLYNFIESTNGKPILLKNITLDVVYIPAAYITFRTVSGVYIGILTINVNGTGLVKVGVTQEDDFYVTSINNTIPPTAGSNSDAPEDGPSASM